MAVVLVVDDEPDVVEIVRFRLESDGHTVLAAHDGATGLKMAATRRPDLIVLDVMMPGMDGFEVARGLKKDPQTARIPIVMLTARSDFSSMAEGWNLDVDNYVTKPFDVHEFAATVRGVLIYRGKVAAE